jgi:hypothetical protein
MKGHLMDTKAALGAAAGLTLTIAGGVSALFLTVGQVDQPAAPSEPAPVVIEYVDQAGNPVAAPGTTIPATPEVVLVYPDGTVVDAAMPAEQAAEQRGPEEYEEYEEYEHEGEDDD